MYDLKPTFSTYNNEKYLDHVLKGETADKDVKLVGDRVPSFGIIDFGYFKDEQRKAFRPSDRGIKTDILLRSLYAFTNSPTAEEVYIRLYFGNTEFLEQKITNNEMPYTFPPGAILNNDLIFEVQAKQTTNQVVLYWQPVHVLNYVKL